MSSLKLKSLQNVIVTKKNGQLRVCLDPRGLNKSIKREHFKFPSREEIMAQFANAKWFSKLDASSGFWQLKLDQESSKLCTFITPFGRYRFLRLPFGISSAPEVYHRTVHQLFENMEGVNTTMDDIIVWGSTKKEHDERLVKVLNKIREVKLKLNQEKCEMGVSELTFMGDRLTAQGVMPDPKKVSAIHNMERPECKKDLQRFLGMVNYLRKFVQDLSTKTAMLRSLLNEQNEWVWTPHHEKSWQNLKEILASEPVLEFYDPDKEIKISSDAS